MATLVHYTIAEIEALDLPQDVRYELVHGQLLVSPLASFRHQLVALRFAVALAAYMAASGLGQVVAPGAVVAGDDSELQPDVLVVPGQRSPSVRWRDIKEWWLAVEVLSKSTRKKDMTVKRDAYLEFGIPQLWLVDAKATTVTIIRADAKDEVLDSNDTLSWQPPGAPAPVQINLEEIFAR